MRLFPNIYRRRDAVLESYAGQRILDVGCGRRKLPGAIGIEHGAIIDLVTFKGKPVDRGGCINLISPSSLENMESERRSRFRK